MAVALIVAAGRGERLGFGRPKALVPLCGQSMLAWSLGSLRAVPMLAISMTALRGRTLDHRAGFLLSRVDGQFSIEALLDVGGMPRIDALRILADLVDRGILRLKGR